MSISICLSIHKALEMRTAYLLKGVRGGITLRKVPFKPVVKDDGNIPGEQLGSLEHPEEYERSRIPGHRGIESEHASSERTSEVFSFQRRVQALQAQPIKSAQPQFQPEPEHSSLGSTQADGQQSTEQHLCSGPCDPRLPG